ncbi:hypothetical protein ANAPC1_00396 [Anaplasma phagocytophilum]|uniref:Uncharacterized protein n=1 Tax=Anaplasma phagocytophilum TaxID=948 RepID=A0AA45ZHA2_ANAPH|nr:hypothetical protein ANAPC1_00396 [Anaplasma phagocytophilum]
MFEQNIPDTYTGTTAEGSPSLAGGDFSLSSIDFTKDFTIVSHIGSSADNDPGYISFIDQDGNVTSRFLDVYVNNFSLQCKHSPYNNDGMNTAAFSVTPDMIEGYALLEEESHSTQNNVEEAVQVTALECPPCNPVPAEEVASQPSFLSKIIQAFLWLFTSSSTANTTEDTKCDSSNNSKCASASSESLEQHQEEVEVTPSALMYTAPIATEPQNLVVNQEHSSEVQVESLVVEPESQHTDVAVPEDTTETITVDGEYEHFGGIALDELIYVEPAMPLDEADFTMSSENEESKTLESMPYDSIEDDVQELGVLLAQDGETVSEFTQDSLSTNISQDSVGVSTDLEAHSQEVETVSDFSTQSALSTDVSINTVESVDTNLEVHSQEGEIVSEFSTQDALFTDISQDSVGVSTDLEAHSQEDEAVSEVSTQDALYTGIEILRDLDSDDVLAL